MRRADTTVYKDIMVNWPNWYFLLFEVFSPLYCAVVQAFGTVSMRLCEKKDEIVNERIFVCSYVLVKNIRISTFDIRFTTTFWYYLTTCRLSVGTVCLIH